MVRVRCSRLANGVTLRKLTMACRIPAVVFLQRAVLSIKVFGTMTVVSVSHIEAPGAIFARVWITQICISLVKTCQVNRRIAIFTHIGLLLCHILQFSSQAEMTKDDCLHFSQT